jgi:DNA (cytosine-5)-methyltransferase 1
MLKMVDIFAGLGGFTLACQKAGFQCVYATDNDPQCQITYQANFSSPFVLKDITTKTRSPSNSLITDVRHLNFTLLTAGFPCQTFSRAGKKEGFHDTSGRGKLFFYLLNLLRQCQPSVFLLENVAQLQTLKHGQIFGLMLEQLTCLGYFVKFAKLNTKDYTTLPQNRERLYIVGFLKQSHSNNFSWPSPIFKQLPPRQFLQKKVAPHYYCHHKPLWQKLKNYSFRQDEIYLWRRNHLRTYKNNFFPTLLASMGSGGYNVPLILDDFGLRHLTPREVANLQGFPQNFILPKDLAAKHLYSQLGNSISIPLVTAIVRQIKDVL